MSETTRLEQPGELAVARQSLPLRRVDDQPVGDPDELLELRRAERRLAAPAAEHRQVGDEQAAARSRPAPTRGRRAASARSPRSQTARSPIGKQRTDSSASTPAASSGCGMSRMRARRMALGHARRASRSAAVDATAAAPTRCASSRDVRRFGCASSAAVASRNRASSRSISAIETSSPRPARRVGISVCATTGRRGAAARRPTAAPRCRPRSSGTTAGRAARRDDRVDERPLLLDLVRAREERRVAEHRVEDQPLVRLRQPSRNAPP